MRMHIYSIIIVFSIGIDLHAKVFEHINHPFRKETVLTSMQDLYKVATLAHKKIRYLRNKKHVRKINSVLSPSKSKYIEEALNTLSFIIKIIEEDRGKKKQRLHDPLFINKNFTCIRWSGDQAAQKGRQASAKNTIHLTKYLTYLVPGSHKKTSTFCQALYSLPKDEQNLTESQIHQQKKHLLRFRYTRPEILRGALEKKQYRSIVEPLVWLRPQDASQAIMQGSIIVKMPGNIYKILHVHKTNGHPYYKNSQSKDKNTQYWFFHEQKKLENPTKPLNSYLDPVTYVTLAGDISHIGLGRLILLRYKHPKTGKDYLRLGVLADTGGRFRRNFTTLDCFAGVFSSRNKFYQSIQHLPTHPEAYILVRKYPDITHP